MLNKILGSRIAEEILLCIYRYGNTYPSFIAKNFKTSKGAVVKQMDRLEEAGVIISKMTGNVRTYSFNITKEAKAMEALVKVFYDKIPIDERERMFPVNKPRSKNKPSFDYSKGESIND